MNNIRKIKVLHIIPDLGVAGAEKLVTDLVLNQNKEKFKIKVISLYARQSSHFADSLIEKGNDVIFLNKQKGFDLTLIYQLIKVFLKERPDVINTHRYVMPYVMFPAMICNIKARFHTVHNIAQKELTRTGRIIQGIAYKYFGFKPIAISDIIDRTINDVYNISDSTIIYNGINFKEYNLPNKKRKDGKFYILHIGRFEPQKNHLAILDTMRLLFQNHKNAILLLVGDGTLKKECERRTLELGLSKNVEFYGIRSDIPEIMSTSDLFILPSLWEGNPIVLLEAMAAGLPIVASNVGGIPDIVENGVNGILLEVSDIEGIGRAISWIIENPQDAANYGKNNIKKVRTFDISETSQQYEKTYIKDLMKKKGFINWGQIPQ